MKRFTLVALLGLLCFVVGRGCAGGPDEPLVRVVGWQKPHGVQEEATKELITYYASMYVEREGAKPNLRTMRKMVDAAYLTATIFPDFGPKDFGERVLEHFSYGYGETRWTAGTVAYNIPKRTPHVTKFSVDLYWAGLNEIHMYGKHNIRKEAVRLQKAGVIPKSVVLMDFPSKWSFNKAHADYARQKANGVKPTKMKFSVSIDERTQNQISSALIYRIMIERTRRELGWKTVYYDDANHRAKNYLLKCLKQHNIK